MRVLLQVVFANVHNEMVSHSTLVIGQPTVHQHFVRICKECGFDHLPNYDYTVVVNGRSANAGVMITRRFRQIKIRSQIPGARIDVFKFGEELREY